MRSRMVNWQKLFRRMRTNETERKINVLDRGHLDIMATNSFMHVLSAVIMVHFYRPGPYWLLLLK